MKRLMVLIAALATMVVMSAPAMAEPGGDVCDVVLNPDGTVASADCPGKSRGNKIDDGGDANKGGGQEHIRNPRPAHGGGELHGGDGEDNGGGND